MRIALVIPPIIGHALRGTGVYTDALYEALKKIKAIEITKVSYGDNFQKFDIVHYPYFDPFFLTLPIVKKIPTVVTVHDLIPLLYPHEFPKGVRGTLKWWNQKNSLTQVSRVITDSFTSKDDICRITSISQNKVNVIYLGVKPDFTNLHKKRKNFILHIGDVNYNKNIPRLISAFGHMKDKFTDMKLLLVGKGFVTDSGQLQTLKKLIRSLGISEKVDMVGSVDEERLVDLYNTALLYIQPSLAEGFGLPVLEAMACGCPVVASNTSSLSEITNGSVEYVNPLQESDIERGIWNVVEDKNYRTKLTEKGLQLVKNFTWEKTAVKTVDVYKKVIVT